MEFSRSSRLANRLEFVAETGSTNTDLTRMASGPEGASWPDFSVLVAGFQSAGRGRSGREWVAPAGSSLFASVLLRPNLPIERLSWLPLMAGLALQKTVGALLPGGTVAIKWPNDLLVGSLKAAGVLSELLPDQKGVVVGVGVNLNQSRDQLPVETATSLGAEGAQGVQADDVLAGFLEALKPIYQGWVDFAGDAQASGLHQEVVANCGSIGLQVRAILPDGQDLVGMATGIDSSGRILIQPTGGMARGELVALSAADIVHLRH